ncbi:MAG: beta-ketoacyl synthase N-terminal-like domain-containing protein [Anaerolineales bacterium]|nr:beta-ketoacyl synthase N-terminal-like domain-containing protein [Anaerolineales bacterium]
MRPVSVVGTGQLPVEMTTDRSLRGMGAEVARLAMEDAAVDQVDALYLGNMLSDELQGQKHLASLIADEAGLAGVEAMEVRAATATGAACLRMAHLAVASGEADLALAVGVEKMSEGVATPALAKALDAEHEVPDGATLIRRNAEMMEVYLQRYEVPEDGLAHFSVNAHRNARHNPNAVFRHKQITAEEVLASRVIYPPIRLFDCSPICDGAAAVLLAPADQAAAYTDTPVRVLASAAATDRFRVTDRPNPLALEAARLSARKAFEQTNVTREDVDFFEVHDAFSIMACLLLEATGFAPPGDGWRLAASGEIGPEGRVPIATLGGLKARGHPIGATALYQTSEIVLQLTGNAGAAQVPNASVALLQSVGGAATTLITHIFGV